MKYGTIDLEKVKTLTDNKGKFIFYDKEIEKVYYGKIIFPNENEKDKTILFSIEVSGMEERL